MNFAHFYVNSGVFPEENKHDSHIELLFRNAPVKSSFVLTFLWFGLPGPLLRVIARKSYFCARGQMAALHVFLAGLGL